MILPQSYIDETKGVRPGPNQGSFNNVIYSTWYTLARQEQGTLTTKDVEALRDHLTLNDDGHGLYKPKNSHDNLTYKLIASKVFGFDLIEDMSFFRACKDMGIYRIWDVITYGAIFGPKLLRPLFSILLFIPALQMIHAVHNEGKVRPMMFEKGGLFPWWFLPKALVKEEFDPNIQVTYKTWSTSKGNKVTRHMQNDGKHLAIFRLYAFKDFFWFKLANKVIKKMLISRYGQDYTYEIIHRYFRDRKHPVMAMWKGHGDIL